MRTLFISIAAAFLLSAPAHAAVSGAYAAAEAASADACARRCTDDGLCMMWVYRTPATCELRASIIDNLEALAAGVSPRAPQFAHVTNIVIVPPVPPTSATPTPVPPRRRPRHDVVLLGGPETDRSGLRDRIGD